MEVRLLKMLRLIADFGVDQVDNPARRDELQTALMNGGYLGFEISRMFEWLSQLRSKADGSQQIAELIGQATADTPPRVGLLTLTERAHAFLTGVRDLGLIDEMMEDEILNQLMLQGGDQILFEDVRRTAATVIFDRQFRVGEEYYGIFEEEWKLLFN